jgi:hypothetical protein
MTGNPGVLMKKDMWYKTLDPKEAPNGFKVVDREKLLDGEASS